MGPTFGWDGKFNGLDLQLMCDSDLRSGFLLADGFPPRDGESGAVAYPKSCQ